MQHKYLICFCERNKKRAFNRVRRTLTLTFICKNNDGQSGLPDIRLERKRKKEKHF